MAMSASNPSHDGAAIASVSPGVLQVVYVSESRIQGSPDAAAAELASLVARAAARNRELGLTGALLFNGRHFCQVLEGRRLAVGALLARIQADPRHTAITVVEHAMAPVRSFPHWSMARVEPHGDFDWTLLDRLMTGFQREDRQRARSVVSMMQYWLLAQ